MELFSSNLRGNMALRAGDQIFIVIEGYLTSEGRFGIELTGFAHPTLPASGAPSLGNDTTICITAGTFSLPSATTPGAASYEWIINGTVDPSNTTPNYTLNLTSAGTYEVVVRAIAPPHPNWPTLCTSSRSDTVVVTVSPEPQADIQVGSTVYTNGDTYNLSSSGSSVQETFTAGSSTAGNTYAWEVYNPGSTTPDATANGGSFTHTFSNTGLHTLVLISTNGACEERDTLYINVSFTTGIRAEKGSFSVFPNPSNGNFTIEASRAGTYEIRIFDLTGRLVYGGSMEGKRQDLRLSLPTGTYQLFLSGEGTSGSLHLLITE
ncbi:MAG: T9SS type A sorting domain-containing protein [Bacteroidia bacterium]|nr:T9SS type A sorting domain-containing protein [Bacteroidia bacterium]